MANGKVEGMVGYALWAFMVPFPRARDFDALNAMLLERCRDRQSAVLRSAERSIGERLAADRAAFLDLPATPFEACDNRPARGCAQTTRLAACGRRAGSPARRWCATRTPTTRFRWPTRTAR